MRTGQLLQLTAVIVAVGACNKSGGDANAPATSASVNAGASRGLIPEHGGTVSTSGGLITEVVTQPDGKLLAFVRGPQGQVRDTNVHVTVRNANGTSKPVAVAWDAQQSAYVGFVTGVEPGTKTVEVTVPMSMEANAPTQTVASQVDIAAVATPPPPRYGGTVEIIGNYAVEFVPAHSGDVAFFVMDLQGNPVPPDTVELPRVTVDAVENRGRAGMLGHAVPVNRVGDHWVAHQDPVVARSHSVSFDLDLNVGAQHYTHASVAAAPVVHVMPPSVTIGAPPPPTVVVNGGYGAQGGVVVNGPYGQPTNGVGVNGPNLQPPGSVVVNGPYGQPTNGAFAPPQGGVVVNAPYGQPQGGVVVNGPYGQPQGGVVVNGPYGQPQGGVVVNAPSAQAHGTVVVDGPNAPPSGTVVVSAPNTQPQGARAGTVVVGAPSSASGPIVQAGAAGAIQPGSLNVNIQGSPTTGIVPPHGVSPVSVRTNMGEPTAPTAPHGIVVTSTGPNVRPIEQSPPMPATTPRGNVQPVRPGVVLPPPGGVLPPPQNAGVRGVPQPVNLPPNAPPGPPIPRPINHPPEPNPAGFRPGTLPVAGPQPMPAPVGTVTVQGNVQVR